MNHSEGKFGGTHYHGPLCRCGSRNTTRIGDSALQRQCNHCGHTYAYRLKDGLLVPLSLDVAAGIDKDYEQALADHALRLK